MSIANTITQHSQELGEGIDKKIVHDLESRLGISLPGDFKEYLIQLNYAELFGDPIYGINSDDPMLDIYSQNYNKEHFRYGFLEVFVNDIDGNIYIRPDTGAVYNSDFGKPIAKTFTEFVNIIISQGDGS